ncbi:hypothetical protein AMECASPLE_035947 [Ameca splendens]|uniref:Uncharacterized protein n=1 Tax=Ameca splendens TaxID=208324 RepID=A0ABV0XWD3_9TELE
MQKDPRPGIEPRTFLLQGNSATNCATVQPYLYFVYIFLLLVHADCFNVTTSHSNINSDTALCTDGWKADLQALTISGSVETSVERIRAFLVFFFSVS